MKLLAAGSSEEGDEQMRVHARKSFAYGKRYFLQLSSLSLSSGRCCCCCSCCCCCICCCAKANMRTWHCTEELRRQLKTWQDNGQRTNSPSVCLPHPPLPSTSCVLLFGLHVAAKHKLKLLRLRLRLGCFAA